MTRIRRLALDISSWVTWLASSECKEWAEGLEREVAYIDSDWKALWWAIGSTRIVFDRPEPPMQSLAEVPRAAKKLVDRVRGGAGAHSLIFFGPSYLVQYFYARGWRPHLGCALILSLSLTLGIDLLLEWRRMKEPLKVINGDIEACALFYRAELEHLRSRAWIEPTALACFCAAATLVPEQLIFSVGLGLSCFVSWRIFLPTRRTILRRIERLEFLMAEKASR